MKSKITAMFFLGSLFMPFVAFADVTPGTSYIGSIEVPRASKIQMSSEIVQFTIPAKLVAPMNGGEAPMSMPARAIFWMKNSEKTAITEDVFFPITYEVGVSGDMKQYAKNVRVWVNGKKVTTTAVTKSYTTYKGPKAILSDRGSGYAFKMTVPAKKTIPIVVRFDAPVGYSYFDASQPTVNYLLASGAAWAGKINKAVIQFMYPMAARANWVVQKSDSKPTATRKTVSGHIVKFTYEKLEPAADATPGYIFLTPDQAKKDPKATPRTEKYPGCDAQHPQNCP